MGAGSPLGPVRPWLPGCTDLETRPETLLSLVFGQRRAEKVPFDPPRLSTSARLGNLVSHGGVAQW